MTHLQTALDYLNELPPHSPEHTAAEGLIDRLIEAGTFTYADQHEYERYIAPRKDS